MARRVADDCVKLGPAAGVRRQIARDANHGVAVNGPEFGVRNQRLAIIHQTRPRDRPTLEHAFGNAIAAMIGQGICPRSEEHTSELQSLMRISYAAFCLKKKTIKTHTTITHKINTI